MLAHDHLGTCRTAFARVIGGNFRDHHAHLDGVSVEQREQRWGRMNRHPHSFVHEGKGTCYCRGEFARNGAAVLSAGIRDHLVMKTTESGFEGYNACDFTTLPPTDERILATRMTMDWFFGEGAEDFAEADGKILEAASQVFAGHYRPSVQRTLFEVGEAALAAVPGISRIALKMPKVHFLGLDLTRLGRPGNERVFLPTDEPQGEIEAVVSR